MKPKPRRSDPGLQSPIVKCLPIPPKWPQCHILSCMKCNQHLGQLQDISCQRGEVPDCEQRQGSCCSTVGGRTLKTTHRHPGPGQTSPGHSGPGHPGPRTSRSPDIQVPGHPGLSDIQVFRTSRSQDIQVPGHPSLLDIQVPGHPGLLDIQVPGHPGLSDFQVLSLIVKMFIRSCFLINLLKCLNGHKSLGSLFVCQK